MPRSFLFPGRDTEQLSPIERQLEQLFDRTDRPGNRLTPARFFKSNQFLDFVNTQFGPIPVPPGGRVVNQSPTEVRFLDEQGFEHVLQRDVSQAGGFGGQIIERTNRPPVLPDQRAQSFLDTLQTQLQQRFAAQPTLQTLDPETLAALQAISAAETQRNQQQFQDQSGDLLARLFGVGVQRSSIATDAAGQLAQLQGLITQQQQSDAAQRELGLRQFLTSLQQQQTGLSADLFANLTGQGTQRDIAGAGIGVDLKRLEEQARQFNRGFGLESTRVQTDIERLQQENSPFNKFLKTLNAAAGLASGVGGAIGGIGALRNRNQPIGDLTDLGQPRPPGF